MRLFNFWWRARRKNYFYDYYWSFKDGLKMNILSGGKFNDGNKFIWILF